MLNLNKTSGHGVGVPPQQRKVEDRPADRSAGVNVTEFGLPHLASNFSAVNVNDPSFFATTYDLTWPNGGNISAGLRGSKSPFCITTFDYPFPANVTDMYTEANTNSTDCEFILGEDCLNQLYYEGNNLDGDQCVRPSWRDIPECNGTLGAAIQTSAAGGPFTFSLSTSDINLDSANNSLTDAQPILSGEGLWAFESGVINGADAAQGYLESTNRLQIFMFNTWINITNGRVSKPNILCMRVNTTTASGNTSAASSLGRTTAAMAAVLVTIFAMLA
ncbi:uncharacterized protein ColSpa_06166 [Colletotrichum spaethianum]|uniref:Uncharacterized protein n=1 Tax=Colletotrichum spaethianum TaxID=700344 RepID=A0AA37LHC3_9PEZI|nr:uncharacterized protein ColSpa_06166 [Colletotrichum spaethianum]GKT45985.1 hypothetical protein ColSpa_06166 [Colletotrichum spaethianum]